MGGPCSPSPGTTDTLNRCFPRTYLFKEDDSLVVSVKTRTQGREGAGVGDSGHRHDMARRPTHNNERFSDDRRRCKSDTTAKRGRGGRGCETWARTRARVTMCVLLLLTLLPLTKSVEVGAENSGGTESSPQETFPPADNSILSEFEFRTNNFLARSTPKKGQLLKPELTLGGDVENGSLHLPSAVTHLDEWEPVPSSRSPSPMVLKKSPSREEEREQRAHQVIAESITTLLGKRQASKEEVVTTAQNGRVAKRSRPLSRTKVGKSPSLLGMEFTTRSQSLNKEKERTVEETEGDTFVFGTPKNGVVFHPVLLEPGVEGENDGATMDPRKDDDARVTYEDPRQREEKQRLASILGGKEGAAPKHRGKRRSTRLAGF